MGWAMGAVRTVIRTLRDWAVFWTRRMRAALPWTVMRALVRTVNVR